MVSGLCAISSALIPSLKDFWLELILFEVSLKYMNARFFSQRFYCLRVGNDPIICRFVSLGQVILQADTLFRYFQFILEVFNGLLHGFSPCPSVCVISWVETGVDCLEAYFVRFVGYLLEESGAMLLFALITKLQVIISRHLGRCLFFLNKI